MDLAHAYRQAVARRAFLGRTSTILGAASLASLLGASRTTAARAETPPLLAPRAKRVIFLFMSGGPSHIDLFDPKPLLNRREGEPIPKSLIKNHEFAMIKTAEPLVKGSPYAMLQQGNSGNAVSELLPFTSKFVDDMAIVRSMHTDTFNHDPAVTFLNSGSVRFGFPSMGSWMSYGLGSENEDLPAFVVLVSGGKGQPLLSSYWGSGFLPSRHQGVVLRSSGDPVLYLSNPRGVDARARREQLDLIQWMNRRHLGELGDPEILTRIEAFELAYRMQMSVPDLVDVAREPASTRELYGVEPGKPSFSANCLLARRLVERGVRFVQLYHKGWDHHGGLESGLPKLCREVDRGTGALLADLKERGLLEDTLVVWGGEFGRTPIAQGGGTSYGRDHHPHGFSLWMAGGGVQPGVTYGATDEFGYFATENKVHVHDLHATILHLLGIDHEKLTFRTRGRDFRLTDVAGEIVRGVIA